MVGMIPSLSLDPTKDRCYSRKKGGGPIFGKAKHWTKRDWLRHGLTTFMASVFFILIRSFLEDFEGSREMLMQFIVFFVIFGGLQILFGGIFKKIQT
ncbi:hypothetical protein [Isachenkonia alkalipeptolytica]|uniref:Uncharacterized protein n=1 Tax=Isachenkonia alkalipeptolytica TaxID=2565777 RepID=A0AA43XJ57_9CLOT|nr:hypothetical protein [Isachenkonia alkalipeptolytica]NBG87768.1 hypothetical protein [Isachenkonia alkalipeptolytica]